VTGRWTWCFCCTSVSSTSVVLQWCILHIKLLSYWISCLLVHPQLVLHIVIVHILLLVCEVRRTLIVVSADVCGPRLEDVVVQVCVGGDWREVCSVWRGCSQLQSSHCRMHC